MRNFSPRRGEEIICSYERIKLPRDKIVLTWCAGVLEIGFREAAGEISRNETQPALDVTRVMMISPRVEFSDYHCRN